MFLVTGASGKAGSEVVHALVERGADVRVFVRDREKAETLFGDKVELALGDFADPNAVRAALADVLAVFLSGADDPRRVEWETRLIDEAASAGVAQIVKLSSIEARPGAPVSFWDWHGQIERHLRGSGVPAVIIRSSFYMSNLLAAAGQVAAGQLYAPAGEARIAMIDPRDVGAAVAAVLAGDGHAGRTYVLTGPEAIGYAEVAAELSAATGLPVEFVDVPDEQAREAMSAAGLPDFLAEGIVGVLAMARQGVAERVTSTVESLTGCRPHSFAAWARDHAVLFTPATVGAGR